MCMIYEQCNYSILLLLYDFEMENVEIKQTWNLKQNSFMHTFENITYWCTCTYVSNSVLPTCHFQKKYYWAWENIFLGEKRDFCARSAHHEREVLFCGAILALFLNILFKNINNVCKFQNFNSPVKTKTKTKTYFCRKKRTCVFYTKKRTKYV